MLIGGVNQIPKFYNLKMWVQSLIGTLIVTSVEFIFGIVLNVLLGLSLWDYSDMMFNVMGQVCLLYAVLWFLLMPLAIWLEDYIRWAFWREGEKYTLLSAYKDTFTGR